MSDWILIPCLKALFTEFNLIAPGRDKASDGSIGDAAHQAEVSDHNPDETGSVPIHDADKVNEVHAIDVTSAGPWPQMGGKPGSMETVVQHLLARCRAGLEDRLRYIIYNRRIWSASSGWVQKTYTGASPHTEHAHFSASYGSAQEADTHSWHLEDLVALSDDDVNKIVDAVWSKRLPNPYVDGQNNQLATLLQYAPSREILYTRFKPEFDRVISTLQLAISGVDEAVISALADAGRSDQEVADALRAALGDRAVAVGALLAA